MSKIILLILLLLTGCYQSQNNQDMIIAIHKCKIAGLRAVWLHNPEGEYVIQCRPHIKKTKR